MNFCPYCGVKILSQEARFCMNCGKSIEVFMGQVTTHTSKTSNSVSSFLMNDDKFNEKIQVSPEHKTSCKFKGRGMVSGIARGKILIVDSNLDDYIANYMPGTKATEKKKAADALVAVAENLKKSIDRFNAQGFNEQAGILEAHRLLVEDPAMSGLIDEQIDISGSAPQAVLDAYESPAQIFEAMEDEYFHGRAVDMRDVGKRIAKYLLGIKEPEIVGKVIVAGKDIEPSVIAGLSTDKIAGVILGVDSTTTHAVIIAKIRAIPTIVGVGDDISKMTNGDYVTINGTTGEILLGG